jgi:hypothetical protein
VGDAEVVIKEIAVGGRAIPCCTKHFSQRLVQIKRDQSKNQTRPFTLSGNAARFDWAEVRCGSKAEKLNASLCFPLCTLRADISQCRRHVRFVPTFGLMHRSKGELYSTTSSATASKVEGTVMPSALAVLRLMTRVNLVACSIGRSPGFAPCNIFPA